MVDEFLAGQDLKLRETLLPLPVAPDVAPAVGDRSAP